MTIELYANSEEKSKTKLIVDGQEINLRGIYRITAQLSSLGDEPFIKFITERVGERTEKCSGKVCETI